MNRCLSAAPAALFCLFVNVGAGAATATGPTVETVEYGVFATSGVHRVAMPHSVSGEMNVIDHARLKRTAAVVAAQPGRSFGWRYRFHNLPAGAIVILRTVHPALTNPKTGKTMAYSERQVRIVHPKAARYTGYTFDYPWEMAEGDWRFQILYRGHLIAERPFRIVVPLN